MIILKKKKLLYIMKKVKVIIIEKIKINEGK